MYIDRDRGRETEGYAGRKKMHNKVWKRYCWFYLSINLLRHLIIGLKNITFVVIKTIIAFLDKSLLFMSYWMKLAVSSIVDNNLRDWGSK